MQIDWITVVAQAVNFLVLVWLLQRFLYAPITRAMARREQRIEDRLREARETRERAEDEAAELREARETLEAQRDEKLDAAREEAVALRTRLEQELRDEIDEKRETLRTRLDTERAEIARELRRRIGERLFAAVRATLRDLADTDLTDRLAARFTRELEAMDDAPRARLAEAASAGDGVAQVTCATDLPAPAKSRITRAVHDSVAPELEVTYETDPDMLLGLRLTVGPHVVEWSAERHLARLETIVSEALDNTNSGARDAA